MVSLALKFIFSCTSMCNLKSYFFQEHKAVYVILIVCLSFSLDHKLLINKGDISKMTEQEAPGPCSPTEIPNEQQHMDRSSFVGTLEPGKKPLQPSECLSKKKPHSKQQDIRDFFAHLYPTPFPVQHDVVRRMPSNLWSLLQDRRKEQNLLATFWFVWGTGFFLA